MIDTGATTGTVSAPTIQTHLSIHIYQMSFSSASANGTSILSLRPSHLVLSWILSLPWPSIFGWSPIPADYTFEISLHSLPSFLFPLPLPSPGPHLLMPRFLQPSPYLFLLLIQCSIRSPATCILKYCSPGEKL